MAAFTATELVQLPRIGAQAARALGTQVLAAAKAHKVPKGVVKAHSQLTAAHTALGTALVVQFGAGTAEDPGDSDPVIQELDRILDNCWSGVDDRLLGLTKLPGGTAGAAEAASLRRRLFPGGLAFLKLAYRLEWSESQTRLDLIEQEGLGATVDQLVGKAFLPALRLAHEKYGRALGMDKPIAETGSVPQVRGAFDTFVKALRNYVVKVVASIEDDEPETQAHADALLAPIQAWAATKRVPSAPAEEEAADNSGTGGAPTGESGSGGGSSPKNK